MVNDPDISTRIIRLLDGELQSDTQPFSKEEEIKEVKEEAELNQQANNDTSVKKRKSKTEKAKMSFWTAFKLSLNNLFTKKARTTMTGVAGSIGIIGVSLVLSISFGVQTFISHMHVGQPC